MKQGPRLPVGQFLTQRFPVLTYGDSQNIGIDDWEFKIWGFGLEESIKFDWNQFLDLGTHETIRDFHCVTTWSRYDNLWKGISVDAVWRIISANLTDGFTPNAVMLHCYGGYTTNLLLDDFLMEDNIFATHHDGEILENEHGGPMRFVCHHLYAWKSAKWINGIELLDTNQRGFWERHGYHIRGNPWNEERYTYQE